MNWIYCGIVLLCSINTWFDLDNSTKPFFQNLLTRKLEWLTVKKGWQLISNTNLPFLWQNNDKMANSQKFHYRNNFIWFKNQWAEVNIKLDWATFFSFSGMCESTSAIIVDFQGRLLPDCQLRVTKTLGMCLGSIQIEKKMFSKSEVLKKTLILVLEFPGKCPVTLLHKIVFSPLGNSSTMFKGQMLICS